MSDLSSRTAPTGKPNTAAGFLFAPGIASLAGGLVVAAGLLLDPAGVNASARIASALEAMCIMPLAFAVVGYATAAIVGVPVYLALPERARGCFALVVPLAGAIAAAPWLLLAEPWRRGAADLPILAVPFGLGVVAGIAFLALRRLPVVEHIEPCEATRDAADP